MVLVQTSWFFGSNPHFPNAMNNAHPALEGKTTSQIVAENLNAMHAARQGIIQSESAEKLQRALRHQVRTSGDTKYFTGDAVYYKWKDDAWKVPGTVIGQEGNQILVKHGSVYIRVHPCHLKLKNENQTLDKVIDRDVSNQITKEDKEIKGSIDQIKPENEINVNEDTVSDVDENTEGSNVTDAEQSQIELSSDDIDLGPESFPSSTDSTKHYLESDRLPKIKKKVRYLPKDNSTNWKMVTIISRAGKSTGKYKNF